MLVKKWMSTKVITVGPNETVIKAQILLKEHGIKRLPVMKGGVLVGIVTEGDLKIASPPADTLKVENVMTRNPVTVPWNYTVGETAEILLNHKISGVPVLGNHGQLVGIITTGDLFRVLVPLTGVGKKGIHFALLVDDRPGSIKEIIDIIRAAGGRIMSILTSFDEAPRGYLKVYLRMYGIDRNKLYKLRETIREKASFFYIVDHRHNKRDIYEM